MTTDFVKHKLRSALTPGENRSGSVPNKISKGA